MLYAVHIVESEGTASSWMAPTPRTALTSIAKKPAGLVVCAPTVAYHEARRKALREAADRLRFETNGR
jgi:hypothetical protein